MKPTLTEQISDICHLHYDNQFISFHQVLKSGPTITFGELLDRSLQFSQFLKNKSLPKNSPVIILMNLCPDLLYAFIGSIFAGCVPSIFANNASKQDPLSFKESMKSLITISEANLIVTSKEHISDLKSLNLEIEIIESSMWQDISTGTRMPDPNPDDIAFLQHSSGTTGLKKGVALTHRQVINQITHLANHMNLNSKDRIAAWVPVYHDMGLIASVILPLLTGIPLEMMDPFEWVANPHLFLNIISETKSTICWQPNFAYIFLADRVKDPKISSIDLSNMRAFINCGEPITAYAHEKFYNRFKQYGVREDSLCAMYAMAENVFAVSIGGIADPLKTIQANIQVLQKKNQIEECSKGKTFVSTGRVIKGCEVKIMDNFGAALPEQSIGEIYIRSDCLFKEYYHRPEETEKAFSNEWYKTGDLGFFVGDDLFVTGRKKDMLIIAGKNIYPQDIEDIVSTIPGVHPGRVSVFGYFNESKGTQDLIVLVEPENDNHDENLALEKEIRKRIAQFSEASVNCLEFVPRMWLVKSTSGKISRSGSKSKWIAQNKSAGLT